MENKEQFIILYGRYHGSWWPGGWFNIKMLSYQYRKSHCGDKTVWPSYFRNGISYTGKKTSLYWIRAQITTQGARASAAMVLTSLSWNIPVSAPEGLTNWDLKKMAAAVQMTFANAFLWKNVDILIQILLELVPEGPVGNMSALVQVMAWHKQM